MIPWWGAILISMCLIVWSLVCMGIGSAITQSATKRRAQELIAAAAKAVAEQQGNVVPWPEREN